MGRCEDPGLREVVLGAKDIRDMENSSKGAQIKYFKEDIWYKQNQNGYEGKAEALGTGLRIFPKIWEKLAGAGLSAKTVWGVDRVNEKKV